MGAARRRQRREAREAAKQILKAGIAIESIGVLAQTQRMKRVLFKVVDGLEKRLDTGQGVITVREGLAAMKEIRALHDQQCDLAYAEPTDAQLAARAAEDTLAEAKYEDDAESRESESGTAGDSRNEPGNRDAIARSAVAPGAQSAPDMDETSMPLASPLRATG